MEADLSTTISNIAENINLYAIFRATLTIIIGYILAQFAKRSVGRILGEKTSPQQTMMIQKGVYYGIMMLVFTWFLKELGFSIGVLLGAAGVLTVAVGFAAQTSVSNIISGLFLLAEKPCEIGDTIDVSGVSGVVISVDLLSLKLKTFDNKFVRIPNEKILKDNLTNLSRFPVRRIDLKIGVAYKENIPKVREILFDLADKNPLCLDEPKPLFIFLGFGDSSLDMQFSVWTKRENFLDLKNSIYEEIKAKFDESGIEIPFPHRSIGTMSLSEPFPIQLINKENEKAS
jgi:small-conductance mechanosensitive channel